MARKLKSVITVTLCAVLCALCIPAFAVFGKAGTVAVAPSAVTAVASADGAAENSWSVAPTIMRWNYGGFIAEHNVIVAKPLYLAAGNAEGATEALVHFSILDGEKSVVSIPVVDVDGNVSAKELSDVAVEKSVSEALGEFYVIVDEDVVDGLNKLPVGGYYLRAWVEATDEYTAIADTDVLFNIVRGSNSWLQTPSILPWQYGEYDLDINKISAATIFADSDDAITYSITSDDENNEYPDDALREFHVNGETGMVVQSVSDALNNLDVGTYYLKAAVRGTDNYDPLESPAIKFTVARAQNSWIGDELPSITSWRLGDFDSTLNMPIANAKHGRPIIVITDTIGEPEIFYDDTDKDNVINSLADMRPGTYIMTVTVDGTARYTGLSYAVTFTVFDSENIFVETDGMPWWGVLLCVVGAFGLFTLILFILHQTGVLRMISSKMLVAIRAKADIDATIASVRAGRVTAFAQRTYEQLNAHDEQQQALAAAQEEERLALETARMKEERKAARRAAALAAAARTPEEKAQVWEKKAATMKERANALKAKAKAAEEKAAKIIMDTKTPEEQEAEARAKEAAKKKPRTPEEKAAALEAKAREAQERAESLRARAEVMRDIAAARAEKARAKAAKQEQKESAEAAEQAPADTTATTPNDDGANESDN